MATMDAITRLGRGAYGVPEAARIAHLQPIRVRRWLSGYDFKSPRGEVRHSGPVFPREHDGAGVALTFMDLVEVLYVSAFLRAGVTMPTVRKVHNEAERAFRVRHPFAIKKFETDGKSIFHRFTVNGTEHVQDRKLYQLVIPQVFAVMVKRLDFDSLTEEALRYWPLGRRKHVTIEPSRAFGEAVVGGGVPTRVIYKAVTRSGDSKERVARWYSITVADVDAAVEYEMSISSSPPRAA